MTDIKSYNIHYKSAKNGSKINPNQDSFFAWFKDCKIVEDDHLESSTPFGAFGVFDGHGKTLNLGGLLAKQASKYMNIEIPHLWDKINENPIKEVYDLFSNLNEYLFNELIHILESNKDNVKVIKKNINNGTIRKYIEYTDKNSNYVKRCIGGCTASITFILNNNLIISAHVGDSDTYIFKKDQIISLFENHSPDSIYERNRILNEYGNNCVKFIYATSDNLSKPDIFNNNPNSDLVINNPLDLYSNGHALFKKNVNGDYATYISTPDFLTKLAMTRSLGDYYLGAFGLSSEPTIIQSKLYEDSKIICGSDGIWDNWKVNEFRDYLFSNDFNKTFKESLIKSISNFGNTRDDMTLLQFSIQ